MSSSGAPRSPLGVCGMCFTRKPLTQGWAWVKLCADCAATYAARVPTGADATTTTPPQDAPVDPVGRALPVGSLAAEPDDALRPARKS